jgi:hypothetical protein
MTTNMTSESKKQAIQTALAELLIATSSELKDRKHPGWAYCVYNRMTPSSLSTLYLLVCGNGDVSHNEYNQLLLDAGLLRKPHRASFAYGVSDDTWEAFM